MFHKIQTKHYLPGTAHAAVRHSSNTKNTIYIMRYAAETCTETKYVRHLVGELAKCD